MMEIKRRLYELCEQYISNRIDTSRSAIADAQNSANEETKSSAGDKYETGRAMAQLEIEKNNHQLSETLRLKQALAQIRVDHAFETVQPGSMVITDRAALFIAISIGKVILDGTTYLIIGPTAPLALKLIGCTVGDSRIFNGEVYTVREIF